MASVSPVQGSVTPVAPSPAKDLRVYSKEALQQANKVQRDLYDWDFNREREFIENLLCQRFNFLLVLYSLFITAAASTDHFQLRLFVLVCGAMLSLAVSLTIWRAYVKLDVNLKILHNLKDHPFEYVDAEIGALGRAKLFPVNSIIGKWIPFFCTASLTAAAVLAALRIFG